MWHSLASVALVDIADIPITLINVRRPGASGKSTILKQMKIIHSPSFVTSELEFYRQLIFKNMCEGMQAVLQLMDEWQIGFENTANEGLLEAKFNSFPDVRDGQLFPIGYRDPLESLWMDSGIQACISRAVVVALPEK